jgi:hypothetical protein
MQAESRSTRRVDTTILLWKLAEHVKHLYKYEGELK